MNRRRSFCFNVCRYSNSIDSTTCWTRDNARAWLHRSEIRPSRRYFCRSPRGALFARVFRSRSQVTTISSIRSPSRLSELSKAPGARTSRTRNTSWPRDRKNSAIESWTFSSTSSRIRSMPRQLVQVGLPSPPGGFLLLLVGYRRFDITTGQGGKLLQDTPLRVTRLMKLRYGKCGNRVPAITGALWATRRCRWIFPICSSPRLRSRSTLLVTSRTTIPKSITVICCPEGRRLTCGDPGSWK